MKDSPTSKQGARLREARRSIRLTQAEVAEALGVKQAHISRIESGLNKLSFDQAKKLENLYQLSAYYLMEGKGAITGSIEDQVAPKKIEGAVLPSFKDVSMSFEVYSDSMAPEFKSGDLILCERVDKRNKLIIGGNYYFVTERYRVFRKLKEQRKDFLILSANNPSTPDIEIEVEEIKDLFKIKFNLRRYE